MSLDPSPREGWDEDPGGVWRGRLAALLREREAPRLRTLILHDWTAHALDPWDVPFEDGDPLPLLRRHGARLARLERLHVGTLPPGLPPAEGRCQGVGPALAGMPALRRLHLVGAEGWELLPPAGHPGLQELVMHVGEVGDDPLAVLLAAPFPALERLDLWIGAELLAEAGALAEALGERRFSRLETLALRGLAETEVLVALAEQDGLGDRLHTLALTDAAELDDVALAPLLAAPWLGRLRCLELRGVGVSQELAAELAARGPTLVGEVGPD